MQFPVCEETYFGGSNNVITDGAIRARFFQGFFSPTRDFSWPALFRYDNAIGVCVYIYRASVRSVISPLLLSLSRQKKVGKNKKNEPELTIPAHL